MKNLRIRRLVSLIVVFTLVFITFYNSSCMLSHQEESPIQTKTYRLQLANNNKPIVVNSDFDLEQIASAGNGNKTNPFIIEDKTIDGKGSLFCFLINNTRKNFILRRCTFYNSSYGLLLYNVSNGFIMSNSMHDNLESGTFMRDSDNITFLSNSVYSNKKYGVLFENISYFKIESNFIRNNNITGIYINNSLYNNITENEIDAHNYPVILHSSNYTNVVNNEGVGNLNGIYELNCDGTNYFEGNKFKKNVRIQDDENEESKNKFIIDFTIIILACLGLFISILLIKKFLFNKVPISVSNKLRKFNVILK